MQTWVRKEGTCQPQPHTRAHVHTHTRTHTASRSCPRPPFHPHTTEELRGDVKMGVSIVPCIPGGLDHPGPTPFLLEVGK